MDFFSHQETARRRSRGLLWRFIGANLLLVFILSTTLLLLADQASADLSFNRHHSIRWTAPERVMPMIAVINCFMVFTVTGAAFIRWHSLSSRGGAVAEALGGRIVSPETTDPLERRFINVTREMSIAANTPFPELYILPHEDGINAFASGPKPEQSAIAVTRGALDRLSRDELQGVVAHEFSHILHGDVQLNIRLASYIFGLTFISEIGAQVINASSDRSYLRRRDSQSWENGNFDIGDSSVSSKYENGRDSRGPRASPILLIGLFFALFGLLGKLVSVLLNAAISREREYLADATAVQLTRNPDGIAGALKKIGGYSKGAVISAPAARGLSHFFLASSHVPRFFRKLFASHPPLLERIHRIDPSFEGLLPDDSQIQQQTGDENE